MAYILTYMSLAAAIVQPALSISRSCKIPSFVPSTAAELDSTPIGPSFEFYMWPSYMLNITPALQCFEHFDRLYGERMPIRIGGTTQDRATYDPDFDGYVSYDDPDPVIPPMELTFGPKFFDLIPEYGAETMLGFNRGNNNRPNTFAAVLEAKARAKDYLSTIELGNEPDVYLYAWQKPVAVPPWNETQEGADNADWAQDFINLYKPERPILSGGGYALPIPLEPGWPNTNYLIKHAYNDTIEEYTKFYNTHLYALSNSTVLAEEMAHSKTVEDLSHFEDKIAVARSVGRPYVIGETNFHGVDDIMDASFGAAIQTVDKSLKALSLGIERLYYHQGTINQANFNWFKSNQINTPFYGGYFSILALAGGKHITALDAGDDAYAQYVIYKAGKPDRVVLVNTDYYAGSGTRSSALFTLQGLPVGEGKKASVRALRLTAPSSDSVTRREQEDPLREAEVAGQYFSNLDCSIHGEQRVEHGSVEADGTVEVEVFASEALLLYLS